MTCTSIADIIPKGHDALAVVLKYRKFSSDVWHAAPMRHLGNDLLNGRQETPAPYRTRSALQSNDDIPCHPMDLPWAMSIRVFRNMK